MSDFEDTINKWAEAQREDVSAPPGFSSAVMEQITKGSSSEPQRSVPRQTVPQPLFASLCLLAGFGKLALVLHLAF